MSGGAGVAEVAQARESAAVRPAAERGRGLRLLRIALRNLRRRAEYTVLAVLGIALSMAVVIAVQSITTGFESRGAEALDRVLRGAPAWIVPAGGVSYDPALQALLPAGTLPEPPQLATGWTATATIAGRWRTGGTEVALYGRSGAPAVAELTPGAARRLGAAAGARIDVGGRVLAVRLVAGAGVSATVPAGAARAVVGSRGWYTIEPPAGTRDLRSQLAVATGLPVTADPATSPSSREGLVYLTRGEGGFFTFRQKFSAVLGGKVQASLLGMISHLSLALGFVIAVSSFLAGVQERRREFGILASIGLTDEVLYFFLMEAMVIFVVAWALGVLIASLVLVTAAADQLAIADLLQAAALVLTYIPALGVLAALVPVHRLLQQRPVDLLREKLA